VAAAAERERERGPEKEGKETTKREGKKIVKCEHRIVVHAGALLLLQRLILRLLFSVSIYSSFFLFLL